MKQAQEKSMRPVAFAMAVMTAALLLPGCGTTSVSRNISDEGKAEEVVFPDPERDAWIKEGRFVPADAVAIARPGMTKKQLHELLGHPHFAEGLYGVREWDYLLNFRKAGGEQVTTCQFKVVFDKQMVARGMHWKPAECAAQVATK